MGEVFVIQPIRPAKLRVDEIRLALLNELRKEGTEQKRELRKTVATWQGETPKFETLISLKGGDAVVLTGPTGSDKAVNKWRWLDEGTSARHAVMSKDWRSKTRPGKFSSGTGAGRVAFVSKKIRQPGIEARRWSEELTKKRKHPFTDRIARAMNRVCRRAFG